MLLGYVAIALVYFGWPLFRHPGRDYVGFGYDPQLFIWMFAWWPHAILHGLNPFYTHAVWAPVGEDLAWVTSVPGLAIVMAPLTLLAGPVASYNVAAILLPAVAAWTAFLLCRYLTRSTAAAVVGGYLFGFSSYQLGHEQGHPHASATFLLPLTALVVVRYLNGELGRWRVAVWLGVLLGLQMWLAAEVLVTLTLALIVGLACAYWLVPRVRVRISELRLALLGAFGLAFLIASPFLVEMLLHFNTKAINSPYAFSADLLNIVVPTSLTALKSGWTDTIASPFQGNTAENGAYLGLPVLAIVAWFAWSRRRSAEARFLIVAFLVCVVAELGPELRLRGATYAPLPWRPLVDLPVLKDVLPTRLAVYVALSAAVIVSLWLADRNNRRLARAALAVLAVAAIVPAFWQADWHVHPNRPAFVRAGLDRALLPAGSNVLMLPYPSYGDVTLWQAEAGFRYRMADGSLSPLIPSGVPDQSFAEDLLNNQVPRHGGRKLLAFARAQHAGVIVVENAVPSPWVAALDPLAKGRSAGGVTIYRVG